MNVSLLAWAATVVALGAVIAADLLISNRKPRAVTVQAAALWVAFYVALAVFFGFGLGLVYDASVAGEFFAGYLTEYSLSVDNLFVFVIIMTTFAVPPAYQHKVLLFGIVAALALRAGFIAVGAAAIERFSFTFYVFGAFLIYTAVKLVTAHGKPYDVSRNPVVRLVERAVPTTRDYHGGRAVVTIDGRRTFTPLLIVMVAIATADLLFALDSIPAIFGLTQEPYLVFTANAFALMGLRQLYFLLHGLLDRLIYLSYGLAVILGFIGAKLILEALHASGYASMPHIGLALSLAVIVGTLAVTTIASLVMVRRRPSLASSAETTVDAVGHR
ncbi:MAG: TerC family protein [Frankiaceae bacterium]|nr:TerC family protein [Frankiaceae bacterium]